MAERRKVVVYLPPERYDELERLCDLMEYSMSRMVNWLLDRVLSKSLRELTEAGK